MPDINAGIALGELAGGIGKALQAKKQRQYDEEQRNHDLMVSMVQAGLKDGTIKDPNAAFQFLVTGGKGKGKKPLPPMLQSLIGATGKLLGKGGTPDASKTMGGQDRASFAPPPQNPIQFLTPEEQETQRIRNQQREFTEVTQPEETFKTNEAIRREQAKPQRGTADKQATQNPDGKWTIKVRNADGEVIYEQPANAPKQTGALAQRMEQLRALGIPEDRLASVAAKQLADERGVKQRESATRLAAYLDLSRASLLASKERLAEMQQSFPYLLQSRIANAFTAQDRQAIEDYKAATVGGAADPRKAQTAAAKIVAAATKQAATLAGKESSILKGLGLEDDEATIRRNLIQEMSGGADPDLVEQQAKASVTPSAPSPTAAPTGAGKVPPEKDTPQRRLQARQYLNEQHLPLTPANIDHYLATAP